MVHLQREWMTDGKKVKAKRVRVVEGDGYREGGKEHWVNESKSECQCTEGRMNRME